MLERGFESGLGFECSGFNMWHFLKFVVRGFLRVLRFLPLTGPYKELLTIVKQRKLQWYGHITRSSGLAKTFLQGTVQGGRRRGRQRKRWEDNIWEWTGLGLSDTVRKAEEREEWRRLVVTSCGAPTAR